MLALPSGEGFCRFGSAIRFGLIYCAMILPEVNTVNYRLMGAKLRKARKRMRLTQEAAAEKADMSASMIGHIERGSRIPSVETIVRLCRLYRVSADMVLDV